MHIEIDAKGWEEIERELAAFPTAFAQRVQGFGLRAAAGVVRAEAKRLVPVDTGALQRSIRTRSRAQNVDTLQGQIRVPGAAAQTLSGGKGARHAVLVEYGRIAYGRSDAQPFMLPALLGTKSAQLEFAGRALRRAFVRIRQGRISKSLARLSGL